MTTESICSRTEIIDFTQRRRDYLAALESGVYKQCYGLLALQTTEGWEYCAIGVGRQHFALGESDELHRYLDRPASLFNLIVKLNDVDRLTFPEIAARLREVWTHCGLEH